MEATATKPDGKVQRAIAGDGYSFVDAAAMRAMLLRHGTLEDWPAFAASWHDLEVAPTWRIAAAIAAAATPPSPPRPMTRSRASRTSRTIRAWTTTR